MEANITMSDCADTAAMAAPPKIAEAVVSVVPVKMRSGIESAASRV